MGGRNAVKPEEATGERAQGDDARHRPHRPLLHADAAWPAEPRPRRRRLLALGGAGGRVRRRSWACPAWTTDLEEAVADPDTDVVVIGLPNHLHEEAVALCARHGKAVLCTKPLARNAAEARRMLDTVEHAGVFAGYLEDLVLHAEDAQGDRSGAGRRVGDVTWVRSRETHPGPHSAWFWDAEAGRRRRDHRPRLPLHRDHPQLRRQGQPAGRGDVLGRHARASDRGRRQRHRADALRVSGAIGQFEVSWTFRGGMDLRDEVAGTEGTIWLNHFLRTGFEMFTAGGERRLRRREGRDRRAAGSSLSATRSPSSATSTCSPTCSTRMDDGREPQETSTTATSSTP